MISKSNVKCTDSNVKFADSEVRMASRFASSTQQEIEKLLQDKVSVSVISLSLRLRLITLTSTLIIPDITKTSSNNCLKFHAKIEEKFVTYDIGVLNASPDPYKSTVNYSIVFLFA